MCSALENSSLYVSFVQGHFVCMYVNFYLNTGNQLSLSKKLKVMTTGLHDCRVGIRYIGYLLDISLKMLNGCSIF